MSLWVRWGIRAACAPPLLALCLTVPATAAPPQRAAYVVGSNDGSVTRVDLDTNAVVSNLLTVGGGANRIEADPALARAAIVHSTTDRVTVVDLLTESVGSVVPLPAGANPWTAEWAGARLFVSALLHDALYEVDPFGFGVLDTIPVGKAPEGMAVANGKLYVANTGFDFGTFGYDPGTVTVVDLATGNPVATVSVATNPQECVLAPDGTIHVVCTGDYAAVTGGIDVLDPLTDTVTATLACDAYPGGACVVGGRVLLNITTLSFASEIRGYDATSLTWIWDGANALLPSFDYYTNLRGVSDGRLAVADFSADLLLLEDLAAPGSPQPFLTGDGPIDLAVVERENPVAIAVSGLRAWESARGVHVAWDATVELGLRGFEVERADGDGAWLTAAAGLLPARATEWIDEAAPASGAVRYRVVAIGPGGARTVSDPVALFRSGPAGNRLAVDRITPNPSRYAARVDFTAPRAGVGTFELFDVAGRRVASRDVPLRGGADSYRWDGRDDRGRSVPPGAYFARLSAHGASTVARVLRVR